MKIFQSIQQHLTILGITVDQSHKESAISVKHVIIIVIIFINIVTQIICLISLAETFDEYTICMYALYTMVLVEMEFVILIWKLKQLFKFIENFEHLIGTRLTNPISKTIYTRSNEQVEKLTHALDFATRDLSFPAMTFPIFAFSFAKYFWNGLDNDAFQLPFFGWFPFDWHNPIGYLVAFSMEYTWGLYAMCVIMYQTIFLIGSCWMLVSLAEDISCELQTLNEFDGNGFEITEKFMKYIQLHSEAKQLIQDFVEAYQYNIMLHSLWSTIAICGTMLMLQMELSQPTIHPNVVFIQIAEIFWAFALIFIYCEFGERVNVAFAHLSDVFDQFHWYAFPMNIQRMLPMMIGGVQQPVNIQGYGNFPCTRMAFKKILNGSFSYFMTLRRITSK